MRSPEHNKCTIQGMKSDESDFNMDNVDFHLQNSGVEVNDMTLRGDDARHKDGLEKEVSFSGFFVKNSRI